MRSRVSHLERDERAVTAISVDAGTSVIKAVGFDAQGREVVIARRSVPVMRQIASRAEQDMHAVWLAVEEVICEVGAQLDEDVEFLAVTAQGDGAWLVDDRGCPTGPAILWSDGRAVELVESWLRDGVAARAFAISGSVPFPGSPSAILAWLAANDPDRVERTGAVLSCGGWIHSQLTERVVMDRSDASAPFLDVRTWQPAPAALELHQIPWAERLLPPIVSDRQRVAPLMPRAAERLGLRPGIPVVMAPYDIASTAIGCSAVNHGQAVSILGTTLCTEMVVEGTPDLSREVGFTVALGLPDRHLRVLPTLAGTEVLDWTARLLDLPGPAAVLEVAEQARAGARGLAFLPYLSPGGERAPFLDPTVRGSFMGLSFDHDRAQVARAVVESLARVVADCLDSAETDASELTICGGAAESAFLAQVIADMTNLSVRRTHDREVGARGAFLVALGAIGRVATVEDAAREYVRIESVYEPGSRDSEIYALTRQHLVVLRESARDQGAILQALRADCEGAWAQ